MNDDVAFCIGVCIGVIMASLISIWWELASIRRKP